MHISGALEKIKNPRNSTVLIECMSNLVANEMFEPGGNTQSIIKECMTIRDKCSNIIIVTNDIFLMDAYMMNLPENISDN